LGEGRILHPPCLSRCTSRCPLRSVHLAQSACLTLGLEENKDITLTHWTLDVTDDAAVLLINELNTNLCDSTTGSCSSQQLDDLGHADSGFGIDNLSRSIGRGGGNSVLLALWSCQAMGMGLGSMMV